MSKIILIAGGAKSGKTKFALKMLCENQGPLFYLATCPRIDGEMDEKIENHKKERLGLNIETIEEEIDIKKVLESMNNEASVMMDCLTLWINNLIYHQKDLSESDVEQEIIHSFKSSKAKSIYVVTNEVGQGLVPLEKESRKYRDLLGKANQCLGEICDEAYLMSCGLSLKLKG